MRISVEVSDKRITDLLHGHGGRYSPWLHKLSGKWTHATGARVHYDREEGDEGNRKGRTRIRRRDVKRGLTLMAMKSPHQFSNFMQEEDDDITFDVAIQYIIFGKVVWG